MRRKDRATRTGAQWKRSRRAFLAACGVGATAGIAGCGELAGTEFEADPVILPDGAQTELGMTEVARESPTVVRTIDSVDREVTITNRIAVYGRSPLSEPTLLEAALATVSTPGSGSATLRAPDGSVPGAQQAATLGGGGGVGALSDQTGTRRSIPALGNAADFGLDRLAVGSDASVFADPSKATLLIPEQAFGELTVPAALTLAMFDGSAIDADEVTVQASGFEVPGPAWFPDSKWYPGSKWDSGSPWYPGSQRAPEDPTDLRVVVLHGESNAFSRANAFGRSESESPGERIEPGDTFDSTDPNTVYVVPGDVATGSDRLDAADTTTFPAPMGGQSYGFATLATPNASLAGQSGNPLTEMPFGELLRHDAAREMLRTAGATDAGSVEWIAGPTAVDLESESQGGSESPPEPISNWADGHSILGQSAETATFVGVVSGEAHPWVTVVNLARVSPDDVVIAAGIQRVPLFDTGNNPFLTGNNPFLTGNNPFLTGNNPFLTGNNPFLAWLGGGVGMSSRTTGGLEVRS